MISPFRSRTGRNQPSNSEFIFGPSVWLRGLVNPPPGYGLAYVDWKQQEFGIAAALSGDPNMLEAYRSGDPYLAFAKMAGAVPQDATDQSHGTERDLYKQCVLAVQYAMGAEGLAAKIGKPTIVARYLLRKHQETFSTFWRWSDAVVNQAMSWGALNTVFGWTVYAGIDKPLSPDRNHIGSANPRSMRNFPMQANGSEMLRLACCLGIERGIEICAPVHDAVLILAPIDRLDADVATIQEAMAEASRIILDGFELGTDVKTIKYPDRYMDKKRGLTMWTRVMEILSRVRSKKPDVA
jgi:DNA polymerase I-like protein with 3'-5' exonuclease and polymerase domains